MSGVFQAQTGGPLTISAGKDVSKTGLNKDRAVVIGPAYGAGACKNVAPCVDYLNPASFALPADGDFGNVGKGSLRSPGLTVWDAGVFKNFAFTERLRVQFRAEFFNVLNHTNFVRANTDGSPYKDPVDSFSAGGFGSIRTASDPRIGQLALKFLF